MQSAAQPEYAPAFTGPDYGLGYPPDYTCLPFDSHTVDAHTPLALNPPFTTCSDAWHSSQLSRLDPGYAPAGYAAFAAPACDGTSLPAGPGLAAAPLISSSYDIDVTTSLNVNDTYVIKHTCGL